MSQPFLFSAAYSHRPFVPSSNALCLRCCLTSPCRPTCPCNRRNPLGAILFLTSTCSPRHSRHHPHNYSDPQLLNRGCPNLDHAHWSNSCWSYTKRAESPAANSPSARLVRSASSPLAVPAHPTHCPAQSKPSLTTRASHSLPVEYSSPPVP